MKSSFLAAALLASPFLALTAAEESTPAPSRMKEVLRARASEEAKKHPSPPPKPQPVAAKTPAPAQPVATEPKKDEPTTPTSTAPTAAAPAPATESATKEAPSVLPEVEVRKSRITELDIQLKEQAKEIRREQKNTKPTEMDDALNHPKLSKILSIFGGESSKHRAGLAQERVELMEAEGDLMEAIAQAKTKEEKAELEKQLDQLKSFRRELEKSLR